MLHLKFDGTPKAVQSFRFTRSGIRYQPGDVVDWKNYIKICGKMQLPVNFELFDCPLRVEVDFIFSPPKSWSKKMTARLDTGALIYKTTKPDLTDNLMKGLIDSLSGIVWKADQQICEVSSRKFYSINAGTTLKVIPLNN